MLAASAPSYWVTWFPGAIFAAVTLMALCWKAIRAFVRVQDAMPTLLDAAAELKSNGGQSVKDSVDHIKAEQLRLGGIMDKHILADAEGFANLQGQLTAKITADAVLAAAALQARAVLENNTDTHTVATADAAAKGVTAVAAAIVPVELHPVL